MSIFTTVCLATLVCAAFIYFQRYLKYSRRQRRSHPLPPGPRGLPWVGNVIGINANAPWLTYAAWSKTYGDIIYTCLLGKDVIIINSEKVAKDLLEHQNYSSRPYLITSELCGIDFNSGLLPYGDRWRLHRRFYHHTFGSDAVSRFRPLQFRKISKLLRQLLSTPDQLPEHVFDYTSSLIMNSVYDYDPMSRHDELIKTVAKVLDVLVAAIQPEVALIVEAFPLLLYLPSWFPGTAFKRRMATAKAFASEYVERPFEYSVRKLSGVGFAPSMVHDAIRKTEWSRHEGSDTWMTELKSAAATAFLAGTDTSSAVIMIFFLMMVLSPEAQEKAQAQIDLVVGGDRLPTLNDRHSLPYVDAILREVYRYHPIAPLSTPRSVVNDDVYSGFHIPKDVVILTNLWCMTHNESKYPDPDKFIPERFFADDGSLVQNDAEQFVFGFGRRACPGRYFADTSIWTVIANVLAVFRISKCKDVNGVDIPVEPKFAGGLVAHPLPFSCSIIPRTPGMDAAKLGQLIAATVVE